MLSLILKLADSLLNRSFPPLISHLSCWSPVLQPICIRLVCVLWRIQSQESRLDRTYPVENTESLALISSVIRLSKASVIYGLFFFCAITVSVQVRLSCPETLKSRHYHAFLMEVFLYGNDYRKGLRRFFCSSFVVLGLVFTLLLLCSLRCGIMATPVGNK